MSKHTTYRGRTIDMDSLRRENEKVPAIGNLRVNAKGDALANGGKITKTADEIARENHRVQTMVVRSGIKGPDPVDNTGLLEVIDTAALVKNNVKSTTKKTKEVELPSGDIVIKDDDNES